MTGGGERLAQPFPGIVDILVQRIASGAQPLGQNIDGHVVDEQGDHNLPLPSRQSRGQGSADRAREVGALGAAGRPMVRIDERQCLRQGDLAVTPRLPAHGDTCLQDAEFEHPGAESAAPLELAKSAQHREMSIVGGLLSQILQVGRPGTGKLMPQPPYLQSGGLEQQLVQSALSREPLRSLWPRLTFTSCRVQRMGLAEVEMPVVIVHTVRDRDGYITHDRHCATTWRSKEGS